MDCTQMCPMHVNPDIQAIQILSLLLVAEITGV